MSRKKKRMGWTIRNTSDLRAFAEGIRDAAEELTYVVLWDAVRDRARRPVLPEDLFDSLANLFWHVEMMLINLESNDHPQGAPGYGVGHVLSLARSGKFYERGHELTMADFDELDRIGPVVSREMMYDLTANVQRILGLRSAGEDIDSDND